MQFLKHTLVSLIPLLLFPVLIHSQESAGPLRSSAPSALLYPDSAEGLQMLLEGALAAARAGDHVQLESFITQMEIPNYEEWFTRTFGQEKGESWAEPYGRDLRKNEVALQETFLQYAKQDGEISTRKVNDTPQPGRGLEWGMLDSLKRPVDIYFASWKTRESPQNIKGDPIGYFMFIEGKFRWDSTISFIKIKPSPAVGIGGSTVVSRGQTTGESESPSSSARNDGPFHPGANGVGFPACDYCPSPEYPKAAKSKHVEGTVVLQVVVQPDGSAADIQVVKSPDPDFAEKAVEAVEKWRFRPARDRDGQPVATRVPIEVTFRLLK
jgi:TonB family protein